MLSDDARVPGTPGSHAPSPRVRDFPSSADIIGATPRKAHDAMAPLPVLRTHSNMTDDDASFELAMSVPSRPPPAGPGGLRASPVDRGAPAWARAGGVVAPSIDVGAGSREDDDAAPMLTIAGASSGTTTTDSAMPSCDGGHRNGQAHQGHANHLRCRSGAGDDSGDDGDREYRSAAAGTGRALFEDDDGGDNGNGGSMKFFPSGADSRCGEAVAATTPLPGGGARSVPATPWRASDAGKAWPTWHGEQASADHAAAQNTARIQAATSQDRNSVYASPLPASQRAPASSPYGVVPVLDPSLIMVQTVPLSAATCARCLAASGSNASLGCVVCVAACAAASPLVRAGNPSALLLLRSLNLIGTTDASGAAPVRLAAA